MVFTSTLLLGWRGLQPAVPRWPELQLLQVLPSHGGQAATVLLLRHMRQNGQSRVKKYILRKKLVFRSTRPRPSVWWVKRTVFPSGLLWPVRRSASTSVKSPETVDTTSTSRVRFYLIKRIFSIFPHREEVEPRGHDRRDPHRAADRHLPADR